MDLIDLMAGTQDGRALENLGAQFGLDPAQARSAVAELAPVIAAGLRRNAETPQGLYELLNALQQGGHERYLEDAEASRFENAVDDGNRILGHAFGSADVSRGVAQLAAERTGIGAAILKQLLPVVAGMVLGSLTRGMRGGPPAPRQEPSGGGLGDILRDVLGGGATTPRRGSRPMPEPEPKRDPGGGLGDILRDVLGGGATAPRRGSRPMPEPEPEPERDPGGGLGDILRDLLGGGAPARRGVDEADAERGAKFDDRAVRRGQQRLDEILGDKGTPGTAADDLLRSVEQAIRRRN